MTNGACARCGVLRPAGLITPVTNCKPGDWTCQCGELNFSKRTVCRKCNTSK